MLKKLNENWRYLLVIPLFFTALCTAYIKHNGISITSPEALYSYLLLLLFALIPSAVMVFSGTALRLLILSGVLFLFLLSQLKAVPVLPFGLKYRYSAPLMVMGLMAILYCIREQLDKLLLIIFTVFWVGAFFTAKTPPFSTTQFQSIQGNSQLPPYIEIVLDEQIGITGGAVLEGKKTDYFSRELINDYVKKDFTVYGQAYSRDFQTLSSFASFLNFKPLDKLDDYLLQEKGMNLITKNKLFELLSKQGYAINVMQSTYVDLCTYRKNANIKKCNTYNYATPISSPVENVKAKSIAMIHDIFSTVPLLDKLSNKILSILFPGNKKQTIVEASTATYKIFPEILKLAKDVETGNAYFIHLLMPHYPYVFNAHCEYIGDRGKTAATYIDQIKCTHKMMGQFLDVLASNPATKNSTIIIHGDHGFRTPKPSARKSYSFTPVNVTKTYNTFFAVKSPLYKPGYNATQLPLDFLLKNILTQHEPVFYNSEKQFVYLRSDKRTDKPFDRGIFQMSKAIGSKETDVSLIN
ncbi:sulfatase-like hydrolase/transferase [Legionella lytica]|uniref:Sulfatase-like hydrolase/transferase n=1 Tax=Legionella lytica TaxID=96232 RepID=A0ABY4Y7B1_9GAMM|nr:sulfatase-like hydrolase/transferase [Legionella lytica]USQ13528.1 sulfatase-like hydrolase/transferase [Legionella lytica]